jgi:hypothetical protein
LSICHGDLCHSHSWSGYYHETSGCWWHRLLLLINIRCLMISTFCCKANVAFADVDIDLLVREELVLALLEMVCVCCRVILTLRRPDICDAGWCTKILLDIKNRYRYISMLWHESRGCTYMGVFFLLYGSHGSTEENWWLFLWENVCLLHSTRIPEGKQIERKFQLGLEPPWFSFWPQSHTGLGCSGLEVVILCCQSLYLLLNEIKQVVTVTSICAAEFPDFTPKNSILLQTCLPDPFYPKIPRVSHGTWFLPVYPVTQNYPWLRLVTSDCPTWTHWTSVVLLHRPLLFELPQEQG